MSARASDSALVAAQRELARTLQRDANLDLEVQSLTKVLLILCNSELDFASVYREIMAIICFDLRVFAQDQGNDTSMTKFRNELTYSLREIDQRSRRFSTLLQEHRDVADTVCMLHFAVDSIQILKPLS